MEKISLCIPNYKRTNLLVESFSNILKDERIGEIIIMDDYSPNFNEIENLIISLNNEKIKLYKNNNNLGPFFNKLETVKKANFEYCVLLDSDNVISIEYLDKIYNQIWLKNKIICPEKLIHHPNNMWRHVGLFISYSDFVTDKIDYEYCRNSFIKKEKNPELILNTGNFFVNKNTYIDSFRINNFTRDIDVCDVGYFNFLFLKNDRNNYLEICKDLFYLHRVHEDSFWINHSNLSSKVVEELKKYFINE